MCIFVLTGHQEKHEKKYENNKMKKEEEKEQDHMHETVQRLEN